MNIDTLRLYPGPATCPRSVTGKAQGQAGLGQSESARARQYPTMPGLEPGRSQTHVPGRRYVRRPGTRHLYHPCTHPGHLHPWYSRRTHPCTPWYALTYARICGFRPGSGKSGYGYGADVGVGVGVGVNIEPETISDHFRILIFRPD